MTKSIKARFIEQLPKDTTGIRNFSNVTLWQNKRGDMVRMVKTLPHPYGSTKPNGYQLLYVPVDGDTHRSEPLAEIVNVPNISCSQLDSKTTKLVDEFESRYIDFQRMVQGTHKQYENLIKLAKELKDIDVAPVNNEQDVLDIGRRVIENPVEPKEVCMNPACVQKGLFLPDENYACEHSVYWRLLNG